MALGLALMAIALTKGDFWLIGAWLGFDFLLIAIAYFRSFEGIFGKKQSGHLPAWSKILFLPYFLYALAIWHLARLLSREPVLNHVTNDIIVGRRLLSSENVGTFEIIVDLTSEFEEPRKLRDYPGYHNFPILDASSPSVEALRAFIESLQPGVIFIHCAQGHGRTGLFALALLLHRKIVSSVDEGMTLLQKSRPGISLNCTQMKCIRQFADNVVGTDTNH